MIIFGSLLPCLHWIQLNQERDSLTKWLNVLWQLKQWDDFRIVVRALWCYFIWICLVEKDRETDWQWEKRDRQTCLQIFFICKVNIWIIHWFRQKYKFSTDQMVFFRKSCIFWGRKPLTRSGTWTHNFWNHAIPLPLEIIAQGAACITERISHA